MPTLSETATPRPVPAVRSTGITTTAVAIRATWYCDPPAFARCTQGYGPDSLVAAISPDLRAWTGRMVRVRFGSKHVDVRIVDCDCATERGIDLYAVAFRALAATSVGELTVTLEVLG